MLQTLAISKTIKSLSVLEDKFQLRRNDDEGFFPECSEHLPSLTETEQQQLDHLKARFLAHSKRGQIAEGAVDKLIVSRLLDLAGLYEPQFRLDTEVSVEITVEAQEEDQVYRGRLDAIVFQNRFWVVIIEQKETAVAISEALPQLFTYMLAHPDSTTVFGMVSNGHEFIFAKMLKGEVPQYAFSDAFTLFPRQNRLYDVLKILKRFADLIV